MMNSFFRTRLLFLSLVCTAPALAAHRPPLLISDVDDTVKLADLAHPGSAAIKGVFGKDIFAGMPSLYQIMAREADSLVFLSGGPTLLRPHVKKELDEAAFPAYRLIMRNIFQKGNSTSVHKRARLEELAKENPDTPFILVGDDGEKDPEIYSGFAAAHPGKATIYMHRVIARAIPSGMTAYHTAFEIALHEFVAGRMTALEAAEVGESMLAADPKLVFPEFAECPKTIAYADSVEIRASTRLTDLIAKNREHFAKFCADPK